MVKIVGDSHIERTLRVPALLQRHLDVDRADVRVGDGGRGVPGGFSQPMAVILLGWAPLDPLHVGSLIHGHFAVVGAAEDQLAHLPCEPFDDWMKSYFCHIVLSFGLMKFFARLPDLKGRVRRGKGRVRKFCTCPVLVLYLSCTALAVSLSEASSCDAEHDFPRPGRLPGHALLPQCNPGGNRAGLQAAYSAPVRR